MLRTVNPRFQDDPFGELFPPSFFELSPPWRRIDQILSEPGFLDLLHRQGVKAALHPCNLGVGRPGTPLECFLRFKTVKIHYACSWEEARERVSDSLKLRRFCRFSLTEELPRKSTWIKLDKKYRTLAQQANRHVLRLAAAQGDLGGKRIRGDTTVVEASIHHPTDSSILSDGIRAVGNRVRQAGRVLVGVGQHFQDQTRRARGTLLEIVRRGREKTQEGKKKLDQLVGKMADLGRGVARAAAMLVRKAQDKVQDCPPKLREVAGRWVQSVKRGGELLGRIVRQTRQVLAGNKSPEDRVVSFFDPDARPIVRGKAAKRVEFGYKLFLQQTQGGFITAHRLEIGNPYDGNFAADGVRQQKEVTGVRPREGAFDRGFDSDPVRRMLRAEGMRRISIPKRSPKSKARRKYEKKRWFKRLQRFRAGIEGTISVANRRVELKRARSWGLQGVGAETDWKVFGCNLHKFSEKTQETALGAAILPGVAPAV